MAMPYDIPIIGYRNNVLIHLRIFKSEIIKEILVLYQKMQKIHMEVMKMH